MQTFSNEILSFIHSSQVRVINKNSLVTHSLFFPFEKQLKDSTLFSSLKCGWFDWYLFYSFVQLSYPGDIFSKFRKKPHRNMSPKKVSLFFHYTHQLIQYVLIIIMKNATYYSGLKKAYKNFSIIPSGISISIHKVIYM